MKEKIIEICKAVEIHIQKSEEYQACIGMGRFTERFNEIIHVLNPLINQEVEKRIAGVMPTKNEIGNAAQLFDKQKRPLWKEAIWRAGANWAVDIIRSRLSQKTEGGGE